MIYNLHVCNTSDSNMGNVHWSEDDDDDEDDDSSSSSRSTSSTSSPDKDWSSLNTIPGASQAFTCSTIKPSLKCQTRRLKTTPCKKW